MLSVILWLAFLSTGSPLCAADVSLSAETTLSTEGYFVLHWESPAASGDAILLQHSADYGFGTAKEYILPANGQITITGLANGKYYFRARQL